MSQPHTACFSEIKVDQEHALLLASIILFFSSAVFLAQTASLQRTLSENEAPGSKDRLRNFGRFRREQERSRNNWANNQDITNNTMRREL